MAHFLDNADYVTNAYLDIIEHFNYTSSYLSRQYFKSKEQNSYFFLSMIMSGSIIKNSALIRHKWTNQKM